MIFSQRMYSTQTQITKDKGDNKLIEEGGGGERETTYNTYRSKEIQKQSQILALLNMFKDFKCKIENFSREVETIKKGKSINIT